MPADAPLSSERLDEIRADLASDTLIDAVNCQYVFRAHARALLTDHARLSKRVEELEADKARMDWLDDAVPSGEFRRRVDALPRIWLGSVRTLVDEARATLTPDSHA